MRTVPARERLSIIAGSRLHTKVPRALRGALPPADAIEGAMVFLAHIGHRLDDRGGWASAAKLPELAVFYAEGWVFAHAEPVAGGTGLDVFLYRALPAEAAK